MNRPIRGEQLFYILLTAFLCVLSLYVAFELRLMDAISTPEGNERLRALFLEVWLWIVPLKLVLLYAFGQLEIMAARFRQVDFYKLTLALGLHAVFILYLWFAFDGQDVPPRSVIILDFMLSLLLISALRVGIQHFRAEAFGLYDASVNSRRAVIVGAGFVGANLAFDLQRRRGIGLRPVAYIDDDPSKAGHVIHGLRVEGDRAKLKNVIEKYDADIVLLAIPGSPTEIVGEILGRAYEMGIPVKTVPLPEEMVYGRVRAEQLRPVEVDDLIARSSPVVETLDTYQMVANKVVLITGAGGSIGSEIVRQVAIRNPSRLLLLDQSEIQLFEIQQNLHLEGFGSNSLTLIGDITDAKRMEYLFDHYRPDIVFHAAAHKHVLLMENQPAEAIKNNAIGTQKLAQLASRFEVERFIMISTDKAINPTSAMGASKRLAEKIIQHEAQNSKSKTRFISVRFGNVLSSSGSVVPIFKRQIAEGGPVTVTHAEATRYFMTIPEAVSLVLQASALGEGGEIFLLDMGKPIKIIDLASQVIELAGYEPDVDIEIKIIGLRPGEKLFEELHYESEEFVQTQRPRVLQLKHSGSKASASFDEQLYTLVSELDGMERNKIKQRLKELVPEYSPYLD